MRVWMVLPLLAALSWSDETLYDHLSKTDPIPSPAPIEKIKTALPPDSLDGTDPDLCRSVFQFPDYCPRTIIVNDEIPERYKLLLEDSLYLQLLLVSSIGVLALMPENVTNWNTEELSEKSLWVRWKDNVFEGPVWDNDDWTINYIGHPVSGAYYYTMARNDGMSVAESAAFSTLMSTFFWEYGYEAFAEVPSIQDLIITPLVGSFLGEGMIVLQGRLDQNDGIVFGSKTLGDISYFLIDPLGHVAEAMRSFLHYFNADPEVTMTVQTYPMAARMPAFPFATPQEYSILYGERQYGFVITFRQR